MFGEDQGRYLVTVAKLDDYRILERAAALGVHCFYLGETGGNEIAGGDGPGAVRSCEIPLATLRTAHEGFFPALMGKAA